MDTPISMPFLERRRDNLQIQKGVQPNHASTTFPARSFVRLTSGVLVPCATAAVLCYGWSIDRSHLATEMPPDALFGIYHWPFDLKDTQFIMNITDGSGNIGQANAAPQLSAAAIGTSYGIHRNATTGFQMLNVADTTTLFATVVAWYPNQASTDYNGKVIVEILPAVIQA